MSSGSRSSHPGEAQEAHRLPRRTPLADQAIRRRDEDLLGRGRLVEDIAAQAVHGPPDAGLVIGVVGEWGSGKTSVLNMVRERIAEHGGAVLLSFDPWLFCDAEALVARFLGELGAQLRELQGTGDERALRSAGEAIIHYAEALQPLSWMPLVGAWLARASTVAGVAKAMLKPRTRERFKPGAEPASVDRVRERVEEALRSLPQRVVVTVDDLDRLEPQQIRDMMRLVRLVGNFPKTTYLLAYSREVVERALSPRQTGSAVGGALYLEKIVQAPHDLPRVDRRLMRRAFARELEDAIDGIDCGPFEPERWPEVCAAGVEPFLTTMRAKNRLLNVLPSTLRLVGPEVALVDVIALETLRLFVPDSWDALTRSCEALTEAGLMSAEQMHERREHLVAQVRAIGDAGAGRRATVEAIIRQLFPDAGALLDGALPRQREPAHSSVRVSEPEVLRAYLERHGVDRVAEAAALHRKIMLATNDTALDAALDGLDSLRAQAFIEAFGELGEQPDKKTVTLTVAALLQQLPRFSREPVAMFDLGARGQIRVTVLRLLRSIGGEVDRIEVARDAFLRIQSLSGRAELIDLFRRTGAVDHPLVGQRLASLERLVAEDAAQTAHARLAEEGSLYRLFACLESHDHDAGRAVILSCCSDDDVLLGLLGSIVDEAFAGRMSIPSARRVSLPWSRLSQWLGGRRALEQRLTELSQVVDRETLPRPTRIALEAAERYVAGELHQGLQEQVEENA